MAEHDDEQRDQAPDQVPVALTLDCRGMRCPLPVIRLAVSVADVGLGDVIAVAATDPATRHDVPAWCRMRGQTYVGETPAADGVPQYLVRRTR